MSVPSAALPWELPAPSVSVDLDPLAQLRAEHESLLAAARAAEWALAHRRLDADDRRELEENMRALRGLLPRHLVAEERVLYPAIEAAEPGSVPMLAGLRREHLALEQAFARLQGFALTRCVEPEGGRDQRKAAQAARSFRERLEALVAAKEAGPFALAMRTLAPEARVRVALALRAAHDRDAQKQSRG